MLTWTSVRSMLEEDRRHLLAQFALRNEPTPSWLSLHPSYLCVKLFRVSQLLESRGRSGLARLVRQLNLFLTGADFDPRAQIAGGLVVLCPVAVSVTGRAGRNLVLGALTGLGTELSRDDVGAGPGRPLLGDDVEILALSGVLGPVRVGDRVRIGPCCAVTRDVADDRRVEPHPPRLLPPLSGSGAL